MLDGREVRRHHRSRAVDRRWRPRPPKATSIGVLDGYLYAGTVDSELFRYCRAAPSAPVRRGRAPSVTAGWPAKGWVLDRPPSTAKAWPLT